MLIIVICVSYIFRSPTDLRLLSFQQSNTTTMARIRGYMCLAAVMSAVFLANCVNSRSLNERTLNEIPTRIFSKKYDAGYDLSCRGSFDGELFKDLDEVCQNCFYLIYDTGVTAKCR